MGKPKTTKQAGKPRKERWPKIPKLPGGWFPFHRWDLDNNPCFTNTRAAWYGHGWLRLTSKARWYLDADPEQFTIGRMGVVLLGWSQLGIKTSDLAKALGKTPKQIRDFLKFCIQYNLLLDLTPDGAPNGLRIFAVIAYERHCKQGAPPAGYPSHKILRWRDRGSQTADPGKAASVKGKRDVEEPTGKTPKHQADTPQVTRGLDGLSLEPMNTGFSPCKTEDFSLKAYKGSEAPLPPPHESIAVNAGGEIKRQQDTSQPLRACAKEVPKKRIAISPPMDLPPEPEPAPVPVSVSKPLALESQFMRPEVCTECGADLTGIFQAVATDNPKVWICNLNGCEFEDVIRRSRAAS